MTRRIDPEKSIDVVTTRMKLIALINDHIATHSRKVEEDAIAAVASLAYNEVCAFWINIFSLANRTLVNIC